MAHEEYEIEIRCNGEVSVRTIGIKGPACVDAAKQFVTLLGGQQVDSELTAEYYESQGVTAENRDNVQTWNRWES